MLNELDFRILNCVTWAKTNPPRIKKYCEPFVGGGAVLFDVLQKCQPEEVFINDVSAQLINTYSQIKNNCVNLIQELSELQQKYRKNSAEEDKYFFMKIGLDLTS